MKPFKLIFAIVVAIIIIVLGIHFAKNFHHASKKQTEISAAANSVELSDNQLKFVEVSQSVDYVFASRREAVGNIDFNEDMSVQVLSPYQGRIIAAFRKIGDEVKKGDTLFTIDSPDLVQAESTLITAAGVYDNATRNLKRLKELYKTQGIAQKDLDQAISDQQSADGALKAARAAVRVFGKSDTEIARIISSRKIDPAMVVPSPITGRVTARNAAPGLLVQPGGTPAPYTVSDIGAMWMVANVAESDSPLFHIGQQAEVKVMAYPNRIFEGKISTIGATVDQNTHRVMVRSEIRDPKHELRPGMFANFVIRTGAPITSTAVPAAGVVREGDGTMTLWVTDDDKNFTKRVVKIGLQQDGYDQILDGIKTGELVVTEGALFLDNALTMGSQ